VDPDAILARVCRSFDVLIDLADEHGGLFPSVLDRFSFAVPASMPCSIAGQRDGDRSYGGSNLIHDEAALKTLYALAEALERPEYAQAADRYLRYFANNCTATPSGLFPWGEHAFWHLGEGRIGNSRHLRDPAAQGGAIHDHLRQAPLWLWEKLQHFNPACVQRFAKGLDGHWTEGEGWEYIRHAHIEEVRRHARGARACDFPRHGGFYILDWAFAYAHSGDPRWTEAIERMLDYWWPLRDERNLLLIESRSPEEDENFYNTNAPGQTLSLAVSLLESAPLLEATHPNMARTMRQRAAAYIDGFFNAPHDIEKGVFVILSRRGSNEVAQSMPVWGSVYGVWPSCYVALSCLCAYRLTGDERLWRWAEAVGHHYAEQDLPEGVAVPAMDAGLGLGLLADLYDLSAEKKWLQSGLGLAERLVTCYFDAVLPRGAAGIDWYESQMGPSFLQHGLARMALLARGRETCPLDADYTAR
jgi:hypothetical protein